MEDLINYDIQYKCIKQIENDEYYDIMLGEYRVLFFENINDYVECLNKENIKSILKPYGNTYKLLKKYADEGHEINYLFNDTELDFYRNLLIFYIENEITNEKIMYLWEHMRQELNNKKLISLNLSENEEEMNSNEENDDFD